MTGKDSEIKQRSSSVSHEMSNSVWEFMIWKGECVWNSTAASLGDLCSTPRTAWQEGTSICMCGKMKEELASKEWSKSLSYFRTWNTKEIRVPSARSPEGLQTLTWKNRIPLTDWVTKMQHWANSTLIFNRLKILLYCNTESIHALTRGGRAWNTYFQFICAISSFLHKIIVSAWGQELVLLIISIFLQSDLLIASFDYVNPLTSKV